MNPRHRLGSPLLAIAAAILTHGPSAFAAGATNGSTIVSGSFAAAQYDTLTLHFNYASIDGNGYVWARLRDADNNKALASRVFTARQCIR